MQASPVVQIPADSADDLIHGKRCPAIRGEQSGLGRLADGRTRRSSASPDGQLRLVVAAIVATATIVERSCPHSILGRFLGETLELGNATFRGIS